MEIDFDAIKENGRLLEHVPETQKTAELCLNAVKNYGWAIIYVPEKIKTVDLCVEAIIKNCTINSIITYKHGSKQIKKIEFNRFTNLFDIFEKELFIRIVDELLKYIPKTIKSEVIKSCERILKDKYLGKYLQLKTGMDIMEINEILNKEIVLKKTRTGTYIYSIKENGIVLFFDLDGKKLNSISFKEPFNLSVNAVCINMNKSDIIKIKGKPCSSTSIPEIEFLFYDNHKTCYEIDKNNEKLLSILMVPE